MVRDRNRLLASRSWIPYFTPSLRPYESFARQLAKFRVAVECIDDQPGKFGPLELRQHGAQLSGTFRGHACQRSVMMKPGQYDTTATP